MGSLTAEQSRAARALLDWQQPDLADKSGVGIATIKNFERGKSTPYGRTLDVLKQAFEAAGIEFLDEDENFGAGVRMRKGFQAQTRADRRKEAGGSAGGGLDALEVPDLEDWDAEESSNFKPESPEPFERTDGERAAMLAYWRARPEKWAALASISRECLLRAMEVDRL